MYIYLLRVCDLGNAYFNFALLLHYCASNNDLTLTTTYV